MPADPPPVAPEPGDVVAPGTVLLALPLSSEVAAAIVRCRWVEPYIMAAYVIDWLRQRRECDALARVRVAKEGTS